MRKPCEDRTEQLRHWPGLRAIFCLVRQAPLIAILAYLVTIIFAQTDRLHGRAPHESIQGALKPVLKNHNCFTELLKTLPQI